MRKIVFCFCCLWISHAISPQAYLPVPGTMDQYTIFNFSQSWLTMADSQLFFTRPE